VSGPLASLAEVVAAEWLKLRSTRTMLMLSIVALVLTAAPVVLMLSFLEGGDFADGGETFMVLTIPGAVVGLMMLVAGVLGMAGEFRHGTITYTFLATPRRERVILLKLGFYFVAGGVAAVVTLLLIQLLATIVLPIRGIAIVYPEGEAWAHCGRLVLTTALFGAFGVALSALLRSQVLTVTLTLVWVVLEWMILPMILAVAGHPRYAIVLPLTVFLQATGLPTLGGGESELADFYMSAGQAQLLGLAYIAVAAIAATMTTMRRDVT